MGLENIRDVGTTGEWVALEAIKKIFKSDGPVMQVDWIFPFKDKYYLVEVKHQEMYLAPPFNGHGLPKWQVNSRLEFYEGTGIRPILVVIEKPCLGIYYQYLDILNSSETNYFDTKGSKPRRVYKIDKFINGTDEAKKMNILKQGS